MTTVGADSRPRAPHDRLFADRYRLGTVLGRGAMADVVHADDDVLGRSVAVKIFRHGEPPDSAQRIDAEIRTLASLSHPGLVTLYDAGTALDDSGMPVPYLVMELIDGPTLSAYRRSRSMNAAHVARIGYELAEALAYIHDRGVVHRDIKPANILVAQAPDVGVGQCAKLADFGIARIVDAERLTEHGTTVGTAHYLSPEQATGTSAGPPTDIYTLGLVLIECLSGTMVFEGSAVAAAVARLHRDPDVPEGLGPDWHALLTEMTARRPEDRPDAAAVAHRLRALSRSTTPLAHTAVMPVEPIDRAAPTTFPASATAESHRRRWMIPAAAALFVSLGAAIVWVAVGTGDEPEPMSPATPAPTLVESPTVAATTPAPEPAPATSIPVFSNPPEPAPVPTSNPDPIEPAAPAPLPPGNGNGNPGNGNSGSGNGTSGNGNSGNGNSGNGNGNSGRGN
ncbi:MULTISPECIES: serine/threonine-protein kinase [unclassified Rhodococcus (in: high G+C Gram-positive bacteria)]|uniref:serine/threonine-protein kinase n=1 Tax=unclassified Rhodococcus (in: high G+C Gram-positive bacteria) TaxID=192944 RepID=UPI0022B22FBD|nr:MULTISPECIES: serine/threonine-protein kinase [unclassified Rhodococcus (in: high G+C Gram-positive bacteria)]